MGELIPVTIRAYVNKDALEEIKADLSREGESTLVTYSTRKHVKVVWMEGENYR